MNQQPLRFIWLENAMVPASALWLRKCQERFEPGTEYVLEEVHEQSERSRRHMHAVIREAWLSLPDELAAEFETAEHLRKFALIKGGFHDKRSIHCASVAEARKVASFIRPLDAYAIVTTTENVVTVWTAQSQRSMDREAFQRSKDAVLEEIAKLIQVEPKTLAAQTESA